MLLVGIRLLASIAGSVVIFVHIFSYAAIILYLLYCSQLSIWISIHTAPPITDAKYPYRVPMMIASPAARKLQAHDSIQIVYAKVFMLCSPPVLRSSRLVFGFRFGVGNRFFRILPAVFVLVRTVRGILSRLRFRFLLVRIWLFLLRFGY